MIEQQQRLVLSPYMEIYELVVSKDNLLRQIKELVDFDFIYDELINKYCLDNGRNAISLGFIETKMLKQTIEHLQRFLTHMEDEYLRPTESELKWK